jgi:carbon-monoxide dehydrogenase medium subunit
MTDIHYLAPATLDEAVSAYAEAAGAARILAGGTDLLVQMRSGLVRPGLIVDIKKIPELTSVVESADGGFVVGAAVSGAVLAEHPRFGKVWPGVLEALNLIGSTQVQGRASLGGNLCNGSPAGDSVPALFAAGAMVTLQGPNGRRELAVEDVPAGPGRTNLAPGEIAVGFTLPPRPPASGDAYLRMIPRTEMDIAVVGCGVSLTWKTACAPPRGSGWAPWRRPCCGSTPPPRRWSAAASKAPPSTTQPRPAGPPAIRSTTSAAPSSTAPRWPACC